MSKELTVNSTVMSRKISNNFEPKYYTGISRLKVLRANPTNEQYLAITSRDLPFTLEYNESSDGSFPLRFLFEISEVPDSYFSATIFVNRKVYEQNNDDTKRVFVNAKGQFAWIPIDGPIPENMSWFDKTNVRAAYKGEKELSNLLTRIGAFNPKEDDYTPYNKIIESFYKKYDVTPINKFLAETVTLSEDVSLRNGECGIAGLLTVYVNTENGKKLQKVQLGEGYVGRTDVKPDGTVYISDWTKGFITKHVNNQIKAGYGIKDFYSIPFQTFEAEEQKSVIVSNAVVDSSDDDDEFPF